MKNQPTLSEASVNVIKSIREFSKAIEDIKNKDRRSIFEKAIDWVSFKLYGGKSCMPFELKSF